MENNNKNKKSKFMQVMQSKVTNTMSALMILVAFASFLAIGFNQESYAIPDVDSTMGDSFTFKMGDSYVTNSTNGTAFYMKLLNGNNGSGAVPVFCLEHTAQINDNVTYTKDGENLISDYGLLYILANSYPNSDIVNGNYKLSDCPAPVQYWVTQAATWLYLYESELKDNGSVPTSSLNYLSPEQIAAIKGTTEINNQSSGTTYYIGNQGDKVNFYNTFVAKLVENAMEVRTTPNKNIVINRANNDISVTDDGKYYQTSLISIDGVVTTGGSFNGYELKLKNAPEGTQIIGEDGNEIKGDALSNMSSNTKFYIRVPVNKISENNKVLNIAVNASFKTLDGYYYKATGLQTVTTVKTINSTISKPLDIDLTYTPDVPDTSMSTTQSIYFIGLVILLCGIGIIYANAKPRKSE